MEHPLPRASRRPSQTKWFNNPNPKHDSFPLQGGSPLIFSHERIITVSTRSIRVYSINTCQLMISLNGHRGDVWDLSSTKDILVSGSQDQTVRIWDLNTGRCIHVFGGNVGGVCRLAIAKPEWVNVTGGDGVVRREKWPKRTMIVTGSFDNTLHVWLLPRLGEVEGRPLWNGKDGSGPAEVWIHSHLHTPASTNTIFL